jgi:hypothetical protein
MKLSGYYQKYNMMLLIYLTKPLEHSGRHLLRKANSSTATSVTESEEVMRLSRLEETVRIFVKSLT